MVTTYPLPFQEIGGIRLSPYHLPGMCFFCGGLNYQTQRFNANGARTQYSLLLLAILALVIPTVVLLTGVRPESELLISRGCAVVLAVLYVCYLVFQLVTHKVRMMQHFWDLGGRGLWIFNHLQFKILLTRWHVIFFRIKSMVVYLVYVQPFW